MSAKNNDRFINPYNFVPFGQRPADADHAPSGHGSYGGSDLISGTISCVLRVETPLLVLNQDAAVDGEPVPVQVGPDGKPLILSTSVRGMLRAAYEAVTMSRLGVPVRGPFSVREKAGGKRKNKYPAVVLEDEDGQVCLRVALLPGKGSSAEADPVLVKVERRFVPQGVDGKLVFARIAQADSPHEPWRVQTQLVNADGDARPSVGSGEVLVKGYVLRNPNNFPKRKSDILVPVEVVSGQGSFPLETEDFPISAELERIWSELRERLDGGSARKWNLRAGRTLLVTVEGSKDQRRVVDLSLAQIGRRQIGVAPGQLVPDSVTPAMRLDEFSPADRLFGAVGPDDGEAFSYRGSVRVGAVLPAGDCQVRRKNFRLAPLESPKPQQFGFYVRNASSTVGESGRHGAGNGQGWVGDGAEGDELRGHKVYLHHADSSVAASESQAKSSKVVAGWVEPDAEFHFQVRVDAVEQGDLLPLLALLDVPDDEKAFHRLGGGRPLGFGSVRISVDWARTDLRSGSDLRDEYRVGPAGSTPESFEESVSSYFHERLTSSRQWQAWVSSAKGYPGYDVSYPPAQSGDAEGKNYEWFVGNSKSKIPLWLPELTLGDSPDGAPTLPKRISASGTSGRRTPSKPDAGFGGKRSGSRKGKGRK